jgi:hypothetical protein
VTVSLTELAAGYVFQPTSFIVTADMARAYKEATGDGQESVYRAAGDAVPPLAVAALALGSLLREVTLPPGSLHASESLEFRAAVPEGAEVQCRARLAQRSVRAGWVVSVLETELFLDNRPAVTARATVLSPAETSTPDPGRLAGT